MRDMKADWRRWSRAERVGAIVLLGCWLLSGSAMVRALIG
jgi:hypothetical protein